MRLLLPASLLPLALAASVSSQSAPTSLTYPPTATGTQADDYHGTRIADPYRWLEDSGSPQTAAWVEAQNRLTFGYLAAIPERKAILDRITTVWNYAKYGTPSKAGGRYFFYENPGLLNQSILYVREGDRPSRVLIDPNTFSPDGTIALSATKASSNGRYMAYGVSVSGSDWQEIRVRDVDTGRDTPDALRWVKFSGMSWTRDNKGFFYQRFGEPKGGNILTVVNKNHKVYYHRLGTPQSADPLIFDRADKPDWLYSTTVTHDGTFAIITVFEGTDPRTRLYYIFLDNPKRPRINAPVVRLIDELNAEYEFIHNVGDNFLVRTDLGASLGRVVSIDINAPQPTRWQTVIPQGRDALQSVTAIGNNLVTSYLQDAHSSIRLYGMPDPNDARRGRGVMAPGGVRGGGTRPSPGRGPADTLEVEPRRAMTARGYPYLGELALPGIGSVGSISGEPGDNEMFYSFVSYLAPTSVFRYDLKRRTNELYRAPKLAVDPTQFETRQVFFKSKDGTRIPMFITARKGIALDGTNPTILYGYGGFNVSETPSFSPTNLVWMEMGGIYAVANLRGGGEYGKEWHEAGILDRKQNVFDDFIAAAQYLIGEKYTSPRKLAISGGSNGGLLVSAVMLQRPELFAAALPAAGVLDMLRFHKFTIGGAWISDYGSADDPKQFPFLRAYSPVHNVKPGTRYPATLVTAADHDDRVVPGHSFKFVAALQTAQAGPAPTLIRIETKAGHGAGTPTSKRIEAAADKLAFLVRNLSVRVTPQ